MAEPPARRSRCPVLIVLAVALVFGRTVGFDFVTLDDEANLVDNPHLHPFNLAGLAAIWSRPYGQLYIPATYTAWGLITPFARVPLPSGLPGWTLNPDVFHLANVALHAGNALLVWLILRRLIGADGPTAAGALAFALHPVQAEAVAWVSGFKDTFSGLWSLAAVLLFLRATDRPSWRAYGTATLAFAVALCAKPAAVVVPPIAWLLVWSTGVRPSRRTVAVLGLWMAMALPFIWATHRLQGEAALMTWNPVAVRPLVAADALAFYGRQLVWPAALAVDYGRTPTWVWSHATTAVAASMLAFTLIVAALLWFTRRRGRQVRAGLAVFAVGVGPVLGLLPFTYQQWSTVCDRYLYLPLLGIGLVVAWAVKVGGSPARFAAAVVLIAWSVITVVQTGVWQDTGTLFTHTLKVNPASAMACYGLGTVAERAGDLPAAERAYRAAVARDPDEPKNQDALYKVLKREPGREAEAKARGALASLAAARRALWLWPESPLIHRSLAQAYETQGRSADAAAERALAAQLRATGHADPVMPGDHW